MSNDNATARIEEQKSKMFKELTSEQSSIFYKQSESSVFITAAAVGFYRKEPKELTSKKTDLFVTSTLGKDNAEKLWIMKAIAIAYTGTLEIIDDMKKVVEICEKYANSGIDILYNQYLAGNEISEMAELMQTAVDDFEENHPELN